MIDQLYPTTVYFLNDKIHNYGVLHSLGVGDIRLETGAVRNRKNIWMTFPVEIKVVSMSNKQCHIFSSQASLHTI